MRGSRKIGILYGYPMYQDFDRYYEMYDKFKKIGHRDLYECYYKPSRKKTDIYFGLLTKLEEDFGLIEWTILSYNKNMFTLLVHLLEHDRLLLFSPSKVVAFYPPCESPQ